MSNGILQQRTVSQIAKDLPDLVNSQHELVVALKQGTPVKSVPLIDTSYQALPPKEAAKRNLENGDYLHINSRPVTANDFEALSHFHSHEGYSFMSNGQKYLVPFTSLVQAVVPYIYSQMIDESRIKRAYSGNVVTIFSPKKNGNSTKNEVGVGNLFSKDRLYFFKRPPEFYFHLGRNEDRTLMQDLRFVNPNQVAAYWGLQNIARTQGNSLPHDISPFPVPSEMLTNTYWFMCNNFLIEDPNSTARDNLRFPTLVEKCKVLKQIIEEDPRQSFWKKGDKKISEYMCIKDMIKLVTE